MTGETEIQRSENSRRRIWETVMALFATFWGFWILWGVTQRGPEFLEHIAVDPVVQFQISLVVTVCGAGQLIGIALSHHFGCSPILRLLALAVPTVVIAYSTFWAFVMWVSWAPWGLFIISFYAYSMLSTWKDFLILRRFRHGQ